MKIAIVGGRDFNDYDLLKTEVMNYIVDKAHFETLVSGGAKGADALAERLAAEFCIPIQLYKPDYKRFGRAATLVRNTEIVEHSDVIFAFWNGSSKGTLDSINKAKKMKKKLFVVNY